MVKSLGISEAEGILVPRVTLLSQKKKFPYDHLVTSHEASVIVIFPSTIAIASRIPARPTQLSIVTLHRMIRIIMKVYVMLYLSIDVTFQ